MATSFNPEQTANDIRSKSFLKNRGITFLISDPQRETTGSIYFRDNKIRSCSYIKETQNALKAVPFYDKRDNTLYPTPSMVKSSWNANTYAKPSTIYAGMGSLKPLHSVKFYLFSTVQKTQEIQWEYLILGLHTLILPTLRLDNAVKGT